jgi:hypothetical protein
MNVVMRHRAWGEACGAGSASEWRSGDVFWIIDAVGEQNTVQQCIEELGKTALQGKQVKMLSADGVKLKAIWIERGTAEANEIAGAPR